MQILKRELIILDIDATTAEEAVKELGILLVENNLSNKEYVFSLLDTYRMDINPFVLSHMVAIAQTDAYEDVHNDALVLVRLKHTVDFGKLSHQPVRLLFGITATNSDTHLKMHNMIVELINNDTAFSALLNEKTPDSLFEVLQYHLNKRNHN
ncbi:PTS sugar transporter subunit IIA [Bacillus cereus]|uniref:PTS sugar transporter subunit IIA n=1 Tax=Bacillus cereus TaxID=1396 RepID=UPI003079407D